MKDLDRRYAKWLSDGVAIAEDMSQLGDDGRGYFDARLHLLDPDKYWNDYWTLLASNAALSIPLGGRVLDLCCGEGFWDRYCFSQRAREVIAVDMDPDAIDVARQWHAAPNIKYICADILEMGPMGLFDTVVLRGALGQFAEDERPAVYELAYLSLRPGGEFVGDCNIGPEIDDCGICGLDDVFHKGVSQHTIESAGRINILWAATK